MNPLRKMLPVACLLIVLSSLAGCNPNTGNEDEYTDDGNLKISMRNLYFESWGGSDAYTDYLKERFKVSITPSTYSYNDWTQQVSSAVNANNLTDVFQFNVTQFNYASSYKYWTEGQIIKALPDDLSPWPNVKSLIDNTSEIESLKIDGHVYGIPIAKNIAKPDVDYSPFTYVYRRDWAKAWNVYQEDDVYTWAQFQDLVRVFHNNLYLTSDGSEYAMADVEWGFPSLTNFYKQVPHCFAFDSTSNKYVGNFATDKYVEGLDLAKSFVDKKYYGYDQYNNSVEGGARKAYTTNKCGIFYENLSFSNYQTIRKAITTANSYDSSFDVDEATAIMKVQGPDGKFALEGTDNWFSMTLFNYDISDNKQRKILDLLDYLLSEDGTKLAVYGLEGYDYIEDEEGNVTLTENGWPKGDDNKYVEKTNGAKYLRYVATLGNDYTSYDPLTEQEAYAVINAWSEDMDQAAAEDALRVIKEREEVMWLSTPLKDQYESNLLSSATAEIIKYAYNRVDKSSYLATMTGGQWPAVLAEINEVLGY